MAVDSAVASAPVSSGVRADKDAIRVARLIGLPNLWVCSLGALAGLYILLFAVLMFASLLSQLPLQPFLIAGAIASLVHFLLGPTLMTWSLSAFYKMDWLALDRLPPHLEDFLTRVAAELNIPTPKIGIIRDGAPQAFTYGRTPKSAHIVLSRGLLDLLDPDEIEAVVAHELGHVMRWDMFLMTVAQFVPMVLYNIARTCRGASRASSSSSSSGKKSGNPLAFIAIAAYAGYFASQYVVLWFSRTREFHADRFSGALTGDPSLLARALIKIAYGLAGRDPATDPQQSAPRSERMNAVETLGIFARNEATGFALAAYATDGGLPNAALGEDRAIRAAMRWEIWNPWAKWYELNSTHPLVARRLFHLCRQASAYGLTPLIAFDEVQPESYWDEFAVDFAIYALPILGPIAFICATLLLMPGEINSVNFTVGGMLSALGAAWLLKLLFIYRNGPFPDQTVAGLLGEAKVSAVRGIPCTVRGTVIGRGVPGYIFSEDFVMRDSTGFIFIDYQHPLSIWESLFGLFRREWFQGQEIVAQGWYRRAPIPYIDINWLSCDGETIRNWVRPFKEFLAIAFILAGIAILVAHPFEGRQLIMRGP